MIKVWIDEKFSKNIQSLFLEDLNKLGFVFEE